MIYDNTIDFYPTPESLLEKITQGIDWKKVGTILEPSAGKGNIAEYVRKQIEGENGRRRTSDIDCIEINPELRATLTGKGFRVVHDDYMTFRTFKKYDLIIMNPPFSSGAKHLLKALEMQKDGGNILCILNAETLQNAYTNERKDLMKQLEKLNVKIEFLSSEFCAAERRTDVQIAVIKVIIPEAEPRSTIWEGLKKSVYPEYTAQDFTELAPNDYIKAIIQAYNLEVDAGIHLIHEYQAMCPYILDDVYGNGYSRPELSMQIDGKTELSINEYVKKVRMKYWRALFSNPKFTGQMTSNLKEQYARKVETLADYDFSYYNIKSLQVEMSQRLIRGIESCIIELFDMLSQRYAYWPESENNIHYYNGWSTNKAWLINKKVIIPLSAYALWDKEYEPTRYDVTEKLMDIEKALNYLDGGLTDCVDMWERLKQAKENGETRKIPLKYFTVTFYKKGTCHLEFTNESLLKKLNIFGSQQKRWLPPAYGKTRYQEMDPESQAVVDAFEGEAKYQQTLANQDYFIYNPKESLLGLETK